MLFELDRFPPVSLISRPNITVVSAITASIAAAGRKDPVISFKYPTAMGKMKGPMLPREDITPTELATSRANSGSSVGIMRTKVRIPVVQKPARNIATQRGASENRPIARITGPLASPKIHTKGLLNPILSENVPIIGPASKNPKGIMEAINPAVSGGMFFNSSMRGSHVTIVSYAPMAHIHNPVRIQTSFIRRTLLNSPFNEVVGVGLCVNSSFLLVSGSLAMVHHKVVRISPKVP